MKHKFDNISMNGRMAYVIMCTETFLKNMYPERDWTIVAEVLWEATEMDWGEWTERYASYIPHVLFSYEEYGSDLVDYMAKETYDSLNDLYAGITEGCEDDPHDVLDFLLTKPHEMAMVYEGTCIGDGHESIEIIEEVEALLKINHLPLPDEQKVAFSSFNELHGWGKNFDGHSLSIILFSEQEEGND